MNGQSVREVLKELEETKKQLNHYKAKWREYRQVLRAAQNHLDMAAKGTPGIAINAMIDIIEKVLR